MEAPMQIAQCAEAGVFEPRKIAAILRTTAEEVAPPPL